MFPNFGFKKRTIFARKKFKATYQCEPPFCTNPEPLILSCMYTYRLELGFVFPMRSHQFPKMLPKFPMFPPISQDATQVPNVFPNMFPIGPPHSSIYPISLALSFTLVTY